MKLIVVCALISVSAFADFSYNSTSQVTGGTIMKMASMPIPGMGEAKKALEPQISRVSVKGDQMIQKSDESATITDLAKETITHIDYKEKKYSVVTFTQMKELLNGIGSQLDQARQTDGKWEFDIKPTGRAQTIDGFSCREVIMSMKATGTDKSSGKSGSFVMNNVLWITSSVPGSDEIKAFNLKMAEKMNIDPSSIEKISMGGFGKGLAEMQSKAKELDGITVLQLTTVSANADGLPKSIDVPDTTEALKKIDEENARLQREHAAAQNEALKREAADATVASGTEAGQVAIRDSMGKYGNVAAGALGRFGGLGRKKAKQNDPPPPPPPPAPARQQAATSGSTQTVAMDGVLMQMRITETQFSTASVDSSVFEIPAGFTQVQNEMFGKAKK